MVLINKQELASRLGVSLPTLTRWIMRYRPDFPIVEAGTNGAAYKFDAAAVFTFLRTKQQEQTDSRLERDELLAQLVLPFAIPGVEPPPRSSVSPKEEIEAWKLRRIQREEAERAGATLPREQTIDLFRATLVRLSRDARAFVRQIGREHNWPDQVVRDAERRLEEQQRASVAAIKVDGIERLAV